MKNSLLNNIFEITDKAEKGLVCDHILRQLPSWFGIEEAIVEYAKKVKDQMVYAIGDLDSAGSASGNSGIELTVAEGVIAIEFHYEPSAEIYVMGILNSGQNIRIDKPTCFGEFVKLENRVKIKELTSIGQNVTIGEDTSIEKSVIWDEIKIGAGCIITESVICNNCEIGDNVVLEKAIIAPNCKISSNSQIRDRTLELGQEI